MPQNISNRNEDNLKRYLATTGKDKKKRKHPAGTKPGVLATGDQRFTVIGKKADVEKMKEIAGNKKITIKDVFGEAMRDYIAKHWQ